MMTEKHPIIVESLDAAMQERLVQAARLLCRLAPLYRPEMPAIGTPFRYRMTCAGQTGWISDAKGYRYIPHHPTTGELWPAIPEELQEIAARHGLMNPETCLLNLYDDELDPGTRLGLHQDNTEADQESPIVSVSLGATGVFLLGGRTRKAAVERITVESGDVIVLAGRRRMAYHGFDGVMPWTAPPGMMKNDNTRINFTLRRVFAPGSGLPIL